MAEKISISDKQYLAKILFTREKLDQKVVAKKVGVAESTMSKWVNDFNWKKLRTRMLLTQEEQLNSLFDQFEALNEEIKTSPKKRPDNAQADVQIKLSNTIKNLQTDIGIEEIVQTGIKYIRHIQKTEPIAFVMEETDRWHSFIQSLIKK